MSRVALVTGGQQGIGLAIASALQSEGFAVAIASLPKADDTSVAKALAHLGPNTRYYQHDVTDIEDHSAVLDQIEADLGPVTTLINNAGIGAPERGDLLDVTPGNWDHVHNVNLRGAFFLTQAVARRMLEHSSPHYRSIQFVTSVSAEMVSISRAEYCVSKAGAAMMASLFAVRLAESGIGVFELRPGIIATDMTKPVQDTYAPRIKEGLVPAKRWGEPSDIGQVSAALANGHMQFATGATIPVDGGLSIPRL
ncbi:3-ketoacyl-ACP reductase [Marivita sp. S6314]|uniref:3-ketoacyl-ACP reductase n=1 Tax=Marivita sp. S6314 TaxID=2926406 RepID=UPI001FF17957|nr:3-ketoacyl-ACP reductase [Marivita sp. S6314]MCK0149325.1 3-ketoacyl-ACP reductase [Marivita sp. S6314]